jgi:hypothetical protein
MHSVPFWNKTALALALLSAVTVASAQGVVTEAPDKTRGATKEPASGAMMAGPSTTTIAPKKTHKAVAKAKAASAAASH